MSTLPAWDDYTHNRLRYAVRGSGEATARLQGMKLRAELDPPRAATGGFPYPARNCAQWRAFEPWNEKRDR